MAGLDPATQQARVCALKKCFVRGVDTPHWMAASREATVMSE